MNRLFLATTCITWVLSVYQSAPGDQAAEEAAIREAIKAYVVAFNRGDADALAALWSPNAVYTNRISSEQVMGREAIAAQFGEMFREAKGIQLGAQTESIEFVSPNVAVERGTAQIALPGEDPDESTYTAVYIKQDGAWLLDHVNEVAAATSISHYEHLKQLEWLVGDWEDQDEEVRITTSCRWTKNFNFLTRSYAISTSDQVEMAGLQIIGWDPAALGIRSWVFDSDGGFGEEFWTQHGDSWHIRASGILPDGSKASATNIITYVDEDTFTWQSVQREAGGEILPNVDEVIVTRQKQKDAE